MCPKRQVLVELAGECEDCQAFGQMVVEPWGDEQTEVDGSLEHSDSSRESSPAFDWSSPNEESDSDEMEVDNVYEFQHADNNNTGYDNKAGVMAGEQASSSADCEQIKHQNT